MTRVSTPVSPFPSNTQSLSVTLSSREASVRCPNYPLVEARGVYRTPRINYAFVVKIKQTFRKGVRTVTYYCVVKFRQLAEDPIIQVTTKLLLIITCSLTGKAEVCGAASLANILS